MSSRKRKKESLPPSFQSTSNREKSIAQSNNSRLRFRWPTSHVKIVNEKKQKTNHVPISSSTAAVTSSISLSKQDGNNSYSVSTTNLETTAFEDDFRGLGGSIYSSTGLPSDTLAAVQLLKREFPNFNNLTPIPVMLEHHIYSIITDRTMGMKELDQLISENILKKLYISTREDDTAIIFVEDYKKLINDIIKKVITKSNQVQKVMTLKVYLNEFNHFANLSITLLELEEIYNMKRNNINHIQAAKYLKEEGLLVKRCILEGSVSFWIAIPGIGKFCKHLVEGRKKICCIIRKLPFREILETDLIQRNIRNVDMNIRFYIRDLIGSEKIVTLNTTSGRLFRLPRNS